MNKRINLNFRAITNGWFEFRPQVKIWFQNRRYKTKRKQIQQHEAAVLSATKRIPVQVLVREDGSVWPGSGSNHFSGLDPALLSIYRNQVRRRNIEMFNSVANYWPLFLLFFSPQLQMTYGLNFPSVPLPYFYQAKQLLNGGQHHQLHPPALNHPGIPASPYSQAARDEDMDNNCSDGQSSPLREKPPQLQSRRDLDKRMCRPHDEDVEVD